MILLSSPLFSFHCTALETDTFLVVRFRGSEGLNRLYSFEMLLATDKEDIDEEAVLRARCNLVAESAVTAGAPVTWHGMLESLEELSCTNGIYFYRAVLQPRLRQLSLGRQCRVFVNRAPADFLSEILREGGFIPDRDFSLRLTETWPIREQVCQYDESDYAFFSRTLEHMGICCWFEQNSDGEKLIAADSLMAHTTVPGHAICRYAADSNLPYSQTGELITAFSRRFTSLPATLEVRDSNPLHPLLISAGKAIVQNGGKGELFLYGENVATPEEAARLAAIRAEEQRCRATVCRGVSQIPALRPGYVYSLVDHPNPACNTKYLITDVVHQGSQESLLLRAGIKPGREIEADTENTPRYKNNFTAIPADVRYRPGRITPVPRMPGPLTARIDAAGSGKTAELDRHGRYKVVFPFDRASRSGGKNSTWVRMIQPTAGEDKGFQAPLLKGTEVLVAFETGDPDRPLILGAVPDAATPSPVKSGDEEKIRLRTPSGLQFEIDDNATSSHMSLSAGDAGAGIVLGLPPQGSLAHLASKALVLDGVESPTAPDEPTTQSGEAEQENVQTDTASSEDKADALQTAAETVWETLQSKGEVDFGWGCLSFKLKLQNTVFLGENVSIVGGAQVFGTAGATVDLTTPLKTAITAVKSKDFALNASYLGLQRTNVNVSRCKKAVQQCLAAAESIQIGAGTTALKGHEARIRAAETALQNLTTKVGTVENRLRGVRTAVETVSADVHAAMNDLTAVTSTLATMSNNMFAYSALTIGTSEKISEAAASVAASEDLIASVNINTDAIKITM